MGSAYKILDTAVGMIDIDDKKIIALFRPLFLHKFLDEI